MRICEWKEVDHAAERQNGRLHLTKSHDMTTICTVVFEKKKTNRKQDRNRLSIEGTKQYIGILLVHPPAQLSLPK